MGIFGKRVKTKSADGTKRVTATSNKGQRVKTKQVSSNGAKSKTVSITKTQPLLSTSQVKTVTSGAGKPREVAKSYSVDDKRYDDRYKYTVAKTKTKGTKSKERCYEDACITEKFTKKKSVSPSGKRIKSKSFSVKNK